MTDYIGSFRIPRGKPILVIGGGIAGLDRGLEAAEAGCQVILVEKTPLPGRKSGADAPVFPKALSSPCGLEINFRRLRENPQRHSADSGGSGRDQRIGPATTK